MQTKLPQPIKTLDKLASVLDIKLEHLQQIAKDKKKHCRVWHETQNGKRRKFTSADEELGEIQGKIDTKILGSLDFPPEIKGGIPRRSRANNAAHHLGAKNIARFDIKNFYPSTTPKKVFIALRSIDIGLEPAKLLTALTTTDHLPIGFSTSTKLSAVVLIKLNRRLQGFLKKFGATHTIWVDDIVVSGSYPIEKIHKAIGAYIEDEGYTLNEEKSAKSKITYRNQKQVITGVVVNSDLSAEKTKVKEVESVIYVCEKFGIEKYLEKHPEIESVDLLKMKMAGRFGNLLSINKIKYAPLKERWNKILNK